MAECWGDDHGRSPQNGDCGMPLGLDDGGSQEDQQFLLRDAFRFVLEQPAEDGNPREIWHALHVVVLCIDEDSADDHGFAVAHDDLGVRFAAIDARTGRVASCANGIARRTHAHHDLLADFPGITGRDLRRDVQLQIGIDEGRLGALQLGGLKRNRFTL
jgi:hypothetical protein